MDKIGLFLKLNNTAWSLGNSVLGAMRIPLAIKTKGIRKKNTELAKYKKSKRCYILGLGPSLKGVDFSKLDGDLIATNRFYKFDDKKQLIPNYYVVVDRAFYGGDAKDAFKECVMQYPDTCMVLNGIYRDWCENEIGNINKLRHYFYMWNGGVSAKRDLSLTKVLPAVNNVVHIAIMLALHCGYEEIVLLGCDFNSFASPVANHCYKDAKSERLWTMEYELYAYSLAAHAHNELNKYAHNKGQRIVNCTKGSLLDAYEFDYGIMDNIYYP